MQCFWSQEFLASYWALVEAECPTRGLQGTGAEHCQAQKLIRSGRHNSKFGIKL